MKIKTVDVPGVSWKKYFVVDGQRIIDGPHYSRAQAKNYILKSAGVATVVPAPRIHNNTDLELSDIEALVLVGIHQNNWQHRNIKLYADPKDAAYVYVVGRFDDGSAIVLSHDLLSECMNFRIALDYWKHGNKIYTRD